jgi:protocatechuate 3,4-dioxygenase beta subunit
MKYMNMGSVKANEDGIAVLMVRKPQPYRVPWKGQLEPHIHYRVCSDTGMMSRIYTIFVSDGRVQ